MLTNIQNNIIHPNEEIMPNYYRVSVEMEKSVIYSGDIWIESNAGKEHIKKDYDEGGLEKAIEHKMRTLEDDDGFWMEEDSNTRWRCTIKVPEKGELPDDAEYFEWESPSLATAVVDYEKEIAEKDKEISELKKQLGKK